MSVLGWSISRYDKFRSCRRQYYYSYYPTYDPELDPDRIKALGHLQSGALVTGLAVHSVIETLLKRLQVSDKPLDVSRFQGFVEKTLADSLKTEDGEKKVLFEEYYKTTTVDPAGLLMKTRKCLDTFLASERFRWLNSLPMDVRDEWVIEPDNFGQTMVEGIRAYFKVDFVVPADEEIWIFDWKTGKPSEGKHDRQMTAYTVWASLVAGFEAESVRPVLCHLYPEYVETTKSFTSAEIQAFAETMKKELAEMASLCEDPDSNKPKSKAEFPMTDDTSTCTWCGYRELCGR
jgi:hypothetical protein